MLSRFLSGIQKKRTASRLRKRRRKLLRHVPPGQRLLLYMVLASFIGLLETLLMPGLKSDATGVSSLMTASAIEPFPLVYRMDKLEEELRSQSTAKKKLRTGIFAVEPATGRFINLNGRETYSAASMIKIPVFVSLAVAMDRHDVRPNDILTIRQDLVAGGSGYLQWRPVGSKIKVKDVAELMIVISDNTATNMLIDLLGGKEKLNKQYAGWGLTSTRINNWLADLEGTNTTSPYDLSYLMGRIDKGELITQENRDWMYQVMHRTRTRTLLPQGLGPGARILHKTGDIGRMVGDAGIIHTKDGRRFIVAVQVERPHNDRRANELIRSMAKSIYNGFTNISPFPDAQAISKPDSRTAAQAQAL